MYEAEATLYRALADPSRLRILALLREREVCVCELAQLLPISQPAVSQHLRRLREAGLVQEHPQGRWTYYSLRDDLSAHVAALVRRLPADAQAIKVLRGGAPAACAVEVRQAPGKDVRA